MECDKKLVHESFISDDKFNIYCEEDYNRKKAAKCSYCKKPIAPKAGEKTVLRLRALGKDFHPDCFKCEVITKFYYEQRREIILLLINIL